MNNNLQLVLKSSTTEMSLNDHDAGIYIVPELDGLTGLPEIRTTSGVNAGYDGGWTSAQKFDARSIVIRGVIANEDKTEVERMRRELVALLAQGKNEQLELDFVTETGRAYEVQVRTIACDMAMQRVLTQQEFMITLRADDPLIYDNSSTGEEATVNISGATGGFRIPFEIPLAIDAGSEETVVQNSGLESVAPTIKMYGALHNPKIINHTTNQAMQVEAELGFTEGAWTTPVDAPEGTNVSFEPEREAPIESAKLKGNTTQQTYSGKNLLKLTPQASTSNGIAATLTDGIIKYSGTASSNWANIAARTYNSIPAGNYMLSMQETFATNYAYAISVTYTDNTTATFECWQSVGNKRTVTLAKDVASYYVYLTGLTSNTSYSGTISLMLESGSTATTPFEPYVGGVPAPSPDYPQAVQTVTGENILTISDGQGNEQSYEVNLGKNLFDVNSITENTQATTSGVEDHEVTYSASNYRAIMLIKVEPNSKYTLSIGDTNIVSRIYCVGMKTTTLESGHSFSWVNSGTTITTASKDNYILGVLNISSGQGTIANVTNANVQFEKGSQATSYSAYFTPIELCKIGTYQDYIWKDGDTWKVHKAIGKVVFDGSESGWEKTTAYTGYFRGMIKIGEKPADYAGFCDHFTVRTGGHGGYNYVWNFLGDNSKYVQIEQTIIGGDTLALFQTWLSQNNVNWYYALATPTDTEITNATLIAQLEALVDGDAIVYEGETNIAVLAAAGNMPGTAAIRYYTDKEPDQRDELIVDSRLKTITLNGLDVYHLKTEGSEFPMLAPGENKLSLQSDIVGDNGYAKVSYKQGYLSI